jgi:hypothetical protein
MWQCPSAKRGTRGADYQKLFFAQDHFALAHELVVQPQTVFIGGRFASGPRRAAKEPHSRRSLKNIGGKRAPVHVEFHAQIAGVGNPGYLVAFIDYDDLGDESYEYGAFSHFLCGPMPCGPMLLS